MDLFLTLCNRKRLATGCRDYVNLRDIFFFGIAV